MSVTASSDTLLVHFWYAHPVGHAIEALRYGLGYKRADPSLRVSLALNSMTPTELGRLCPFLDATYPIPARFPDAGESPAQALLEVPQEWDWVLDDARRDQADQLRIFPDMARYYAAADRHFQIRCGHGRAGGRPPAYAPHQQLRLELPHDAREAVRGVLRGSGPALAVMPSGSGPRHYYPSRSSWRLILNALHRRHPDAVIVLVGKLARDGRTTTSFGRDELDELLRTCPGTVDFFDRDLVTQLAVVEGCDLFLAPHTGFGMAALAVGTPWLALSGNTWPEFFFNGVPFYSVLPDPDRFPCHNFFGPEPPAIERDSDGEGRRSPSMSADRIREDLDELLDAAGALIGGRIAYDAALRDHFARMLHFYRGDRSRIWSFDGIDREYV